MTRRPRWLAGLGLAASLALVTAPIAAGAAFPDRVPLPNGFAPEGISAGRGTTFFVGSLVNGAIWAGDLRTGAGHVLAEGAAGRMSVGTEYEGGADRLWVAGGGTGVARAYDATSGAILETYTLPGGFLNDVAVTGDAAYVTDSNVQQLHVIPLGLGGALAAPGDAYALPLTGDIAYVDGFNVNGIVTVRGMLVIVQSNTGLLFAVDPATGVTTTIDTGGYSVASGDGLYVQGSTLYVVRNFLNTIAVLRLSPDLASATLVGEITSPDLAIPTTAIVSNGRLWAANSRFDTPMTPDTEYWITQLPTMP
jgi:hypothetical protein